MTQTVYAENRLETTEEGVVLTEEESPRTLQWRPLRRDSLTNLFTRETDIQINVVTQDNKRPVWLSNIKSLCLIHFNTFAASDQLSRQLMCIGRCILVIQYM